MGGGIIQPITVPLNKSLHLSRPWVTHQQNGKADDDAGGSDDGDGEDVGDDNGDDGDDTCLLGLLLGICSHPLSWGCYPTISSSVTPFSSCPHQGLFQ